MSTDKITETLQRIKNDKSLEDHFFKKLSVANKPLEWLIPLRDAGYFDPCKNPKPHEVSINNDKKYLSVPDWNILDALENIAIKNEENPNDKISEVMHEIINGIIAYRENGERIDNFRTDWKMLKILSHFPIDYIGIQHILFIKSAINTKLKTSLIESVISIQFLPKLIREKNKELIIKLLDIILHYRKSDSKLIHEYDSIIDCHYLKKALDQNKKGISDICAVEAAGVAISKMQDILKEDNSQFNYVWIPTIEDHEQTRFPDRYECQIVHFVRDMLEAANPKKIEAIVKDLLMDEHDIFKRIAYHLINYHYNTLFHLLWSIPYNPLNSLTIHELYELLKANCMNFDETKIEIVLNWIETQTFYFPDDVSGDLEKEAKIKAYYKKEWLLALLEAGNDEVKKLYESYNSINNAIIEHPGFHYWSSGVGWAKNVSPIEEHEFKSMTNTEIASYLISYKEKEETSWNKFTRINLASSIRIFVSEDPVRFSSDLTPFLHIPRVYQYEFLRGIGEAWKNNKDYEWNELLPFIKNLIESDNFWSEETKEEVDNYNIWIVNEIADLIEEGTKNDKHAFSPDLLPIAEQIILFLLKNVNNEMSMSNDLVTSVLNSSKGKVFIAAINYSLRYARLYFPEKENRWIESIKDEFTERLDKKKESSLEFSIIIGWYLPYLNYLDKQWVVTNFNKIFDMESDKHWEAAFIGYIVMTSTVYEGIYKLLSDNGHYKRGLSRLFSDEHVAEKLVQNIVIGYMAGWDDLVDPDGLLYKLLDTDNTKYISEIVTFIWTFKDKVDEEFKPKIKSLWKAIIDKITPNINKEEYRKIASNLGKWLSLFDIIDKEIYEYLQISVVTIEDDWNSGFFLEYLSKHVSKTPSMVGELYLQILNTGIYPYYKEEDIITIVEALYNLNEKEKANRICNIYISKGIDFLRETFEKYNLV